MMPDASKSDELAKIEKFSNFKILKIWKFSEFPQKLFRKIPNDAKRFLWGCINRWHFVEEQVCTEMSFL